MARRAELCAQRASGSVGCKKWQSCGLLVSEPVDLRKALVCGEEERLISADRPANSGAKLVLLQVRPRLARELGEKVIRVEDIVAYELPCAAVKGIRSASAHQVDISAAAPSVCRIEVRCLNAKLLNGIHGRNRHTYLCSAGSGS